MAKVQGKISGRTSQMQRWHSVLVIVVSKAAKMIQREVGAKDVILPQFGYNKCGCLANSSLKT